MVHGCYRHVCCQVACAELELDSGCYYPATRGSRFLRAARCRARSWSWTAAAATTQMDERCCCFRRRRLRSRLVGAAATADLAAASDSVAVSLPAPPISPQLVSAAAAAELAAAAPAASSGWLEGGWRRPCGVGTCSLVALAGGWVNEM